MAAAHYKLDNLTLVVDNNGMQIDGTNDQVMSLGDIPAKFRAFGWNVIEVADGNDIEQVYNALERTRNGGDKPYAVVLNTIKGKGVAGVEQAKSNHSMAVSPDQWNEWLQSLTAQLN